MTDGVYESFRRIIKNRYLKGDIEPVCYMAIYLQRWITMWM